MRAAMMAIGRHLAVGFGSGSSSSSNQRRSRFQLAASSTSTSTSAFPSSSSGGRKRLGKLKTASNTVLDSRDLAVSDSGDEDEEFEERDEDDEDTVVATPSHLSPQQRPRGQQPQQGHSSRALRGSLLATQTLRATRRSLEDLAASPGRFPLTGTFAFEGGGKEAGGGEISSPPVPLLLSAREVIAAVSPFVSEERLRRIRSVARARSFTVLPIVEGLFDRGNLGAVCRTAEAMGVGAVWACDISSDRYRATRGRCSAGSEKWIDVQVFGKTGKGGRTISRSEEEWKEEKGGPGSSPQPSYDSAGTLACLRAAKAAGFRVVVAAAGPAAVRAEDFDWETAPTAFVVGNEARGVSPEARAISDAEIVVPMVGMVESLNVSVASACIMQAALARIRQRGGAVGGGKGNNEEEEEEYENEEEREREVDALTAAMLLRHKGQQGKVGQLWQAPMMRAILERGGER